MGKFPSLTSFEPITLFLGLFFNRNVFWADSSLFEGSSGVRGPGLLIWHSSSGLCPGHQAFFVLSLHHFRAGLYSGLLSLHKQSHLQEHWERIHVSVHKALEVMSGEDPGLNSDCATLQQPSFSCRQSDLGHTSTPANLNFPFYMECESKYLLSHRKQTLNYWKA